MDTECVEWTGCVSQHGYGELFRNRRKWKAHRWAWKEAHGDPGDLCVLHKCDNRKCVNVEHLFLGTYADNARDMRQKGRGNDNSGAANGRAKLRREDVDFIRSNYASGAENQPTLARRFGVTQVCISKIVRGATW